MTNTPTTSKNSRIVRVTKIADHAPMVISRLSGWINVNESKAASPAWIIPTHARARR